MNIWEKTNESDTNAMIMLKTLALVILLLILCDMKFSLTQHVYYDLHT